MTLVRNPGSDTPFHPKRERGTLRAAALLLVFAFLMASRLTQAGELDRIVAFDIEPTTLDKALLEFGRQDRLQIMFAWNSATEKRWAAGLKGRYTGKVALAEILRGTQLTYVERGHTLEILPQAPAQTSSATAARASSPAQSDGDPPTPNSPATKSPEPSASTRRPQHDRLPQALGEVIVTAQKYSQRAFDVPISLNVITGAELQRLGISSLNDLQYDVSGLYVEGSNTYQYIVLRGVSNPAGNGAIVGEYLDDADISADGYAGQVGYGTGDVPLYDLERVEVLKGPQGTLYGDGALGGVIRYITRKPALNKFELNSDISATFSPYGAPGQRVEAMLNVPLITETLGLRVAAQFDHDGGWVDEPAASLKNINYVDLSDVRIEGLWQPAANLKVLATQEIRRQNYGIGAGEDSQGNITPVYGVTAPPNGVQSFNLSNVTATAGLSTIELISASTYLSHTEQTFNQSFIYSGGEELNTNFPLRNETFSEELRLHSTSQSPWQWTAGGFYKRYRDSVGISEYFGPPGPLSTASFYYAPNTSDESTALAGFIDTDVTLYHRLTVGAGVRKFKSRFSIASAGDYYNGSLIAPSQSSEERFSSTDPRVYVQYRLTPDINTYASAAKGFRSGEPNLGLYQGFNPESLWSYDVGTKARLLDGHLHLDADAFLEDYSDYVGEGLVTVYGIPEFGNFNVGDARLKGVDGSISWMFADSWTASAKAEFNSSKFLSVTAADTGLVPGQRLPVAPSYTFSTSIEREFSIAGKPAFALLHYSQTSRVQGYGSPNIPSDVVGFLNFRTGVQWNENLQLTFFVQNLLNDRGYLDPNWTEGDANRARPLALGFEFRAGL